MIDSSGSSCAFTSSRRRAVSRVVAATVRLATILSGAGVASAGTSGDGSAMARRWVRGSGRGAVAGVVSLLVVASGALGGGTAAYATTSHTMRVDSSPLGITELVLEGGGVDYALGGGAQDVTLPEGGYLIIVGSGNVLSCGAAVQADGTWVVGPGCGSSITSSGSTLTLSGFPVNVDARALSLTALLFSDYFLPAFPTSSVQTVNLLPSNTGYGFIAGSANVSSCGFDVDATGTVVEATAPCVTGNGNTATVNGAPVTIDATALSTHLYIIQSAFGLPEAASNTVNSWTLLPTIPGDGYPFQFAAVTPWGLGIDSSGDWVVPSAFNGFLSGGGTPHLVIGGYPVTVDATDVGSGQMTMDNTNFLPPLAQSSPAVLRLAPDDYGFSSSTSGAPTFGWTLGINGSLTVPATPCVATSGSTIFVGCPTVTTSSLPGGAVHRSYNATLTASGRPAITWSVTGGSLPAGLSLAPNGTISGTPTAAGMSTFTVTAAESSGLSSTATLSIVVTKHHGDDCGQGDDLHGGGPHTGDTQPDNCHPQGARS